jgi:hypothetical protein
MNSDEKECPACAFLDGGHAPDCIAAGPETERLIRFLEVRP